MTGKRPGKNEEARVLILKDCVMPENIFLNHETYLNEKRMMEEQKKRIKEALIPLKGRKRNESQSAIMNGLAVTKIFFPVGNCRPSPATVSYTFSSSALPKSPPGLTRSTIISMIKAYASLYSLEI